MNAEASVARMSYAEYCAFERESMTKHEYLRGEVFAMTGGTLEHARLATWVSHRLLLALEGRSCEVMSADARVHIEATELDTYPDVSVVCGERRTAGEDDPRADQPDPPRRGPVELHRGLRPRAKGVALPADPVVAGVLAGLTVRATARASGPSG